jgi:hypothetical protein
MTELEWESCTYYGTMLQFLRDRGKSSDRKVRLFSVACCRRVAHLLPLDADRSALDLAERYADLPPDRGRFKAVMTKLRKARHGHQMHDAEEAASTAVSYCFHAGVALSSEGAAQKAYAALALEGYMDPPNVPPDYALLRAGRAAVLAEQAALVRDIFGNPFQPPPRIDPAWLARNDGIVQKLAEAIYEGRSFDRLPVLADALEEAGCDDPELLGHLRGPGPHVKGCWALDLVLGQQ